MNPPSVNTVTSPPNCTTRATISECLLVVGIVVVAVGQNVVHRRADAIGRSLDQSQPQILGRILDAHVVLRQLAFRRHNLNRAGVRKLRQLAVRPGNLHVAEAHRLGQRVDVRLRAGQEVPACGRLRMPVALQ